ncbi:hypothetical protein LINPERPRIM_LOCUS553 [Linum perenne]
MLVMGRGLRLGLLWIRMICPCLRRIHLFFPMLLFDFKFYFFSFAANFSTFCIRLSCCLFLLSSVLLYVQV